MTGLTTLGRNALIAAIVLLLGVAIATTVARVGDDHGDLAQTGPTTTTVAAPTTTTAAPTSTAPAPTIVGTTVPAVAGGVGTGGSGLAEGGAGEVAMGTETPSTGIGSALGPGSALVGAGIALRALLVGRRQSE